MLHKKIIWVSLSVSLALVITGFLSSIFLFPFMWNYLVVNEAPEPSDVIIVLGGGHGRVEYGIELYQRGYADYILFAGDEEAISMKLTAISRGVAEDYILIDSNSTTTYENARNSADIMQAHNLRSAIVVTSAYHTKRASLIFAQVFSRDNLTICPVPLSYACPSLAANQWWKHKDSSQTVILEYLKLTHQYIFN